MLRRPSALFLLVALAAPLAGQQLGTWTPAAGAFGDWRWAPPVADAAALALLTGAPGECRAVIDTGARCCWSTDADDWTCGSAFDVADITLAACSAGSAFTAVVTGTPTCTAFAASSHAHAAADVTSGTFAAGLLPAATTSAQGAAVLATPSSDTTAGHVVQANDARLSDARTPSAHTHPSSDLSTDVALGTQTSGPYAAGDAEAGNALTGDSATSFFSSGTIDTARLGSGTANSSSYLRGDQTWATIATGDAPAGSGTELQVRASGTALGAVTGSSSADGGLALVNQSAAAIPLSVTGASSQSGNLVNVTANGGAAGGLFSISAAGKVTIAPASYPALVLAFGTGGGGISYQSGDFPRIWGEGGNESVRLRSDETRVVIGGRAQELGMNSSINGDCTVAAVQPDAADDNTGYSHGTSADQAVTCAGGVKALIVEPAKTTIAQIFSIMPLGTAPASCTAATDIYTDTSGALCFCTTTNTWTNVSGVGSCV